MARPWPPNAEEIRAILEPRFGPFSTGTQFFALELAIPDALDPEMLSLVPAVLFSDPHWNKPTPAPLRRTCSRWSEALRIGPDCRQELGLDQPAWQGLGGLVYFPDRRTALSPLGAPALARLLVELRLSLSASSFGLTLLYAHMAEVSWLRKSESVPLPEAARSRLVAMREKQSFATVVGGVARQVFEAARKKPDPARLALLSDGSQRGCSP